MKNEKLKLAIREAGYTYEKLGAKTGVSYMTVYNCVRGLKTHDNTKKAICKALNKPLGEIFGGDDSATE